MSRRMQSEEGDEISSCGEKHNYRAVETRISSVDLIGWSTLSDHSHPQGSWCRSSSTVHTGRGATRASVPRVSCYRRAPTPGRTAPGRTVPGLPVLVLVARGPLGRLVLRLTDTEGPLIGDPSWRRVFKGVLFVLDEARRPSRPMSGDIGSIVYGLRVTGRREGERKERGLG